MERVERDCTGFAWAKHMDVELQQIPERGVKLDVDPNEDKAVEPEQRPAVRLGELRVFSEPITDRPLLLGGHEPECLADCTGHFSALLTDTG